MSAERPAIDAGWYTHTFDALYPILYAHRSVEAAGPEGEFAAEEVGLGPEDRVLDLCCGNGRHMVHLLKHTTRAVGLDYSAALLALAARQTGSKARLVRADMRAMPFEGAFDAVVNFFTSFGYFFTKEENLQVVRGVSRALKPGGRFFIDYLNRGYVERTLVRHSAREHEGYEIHEERWIDTVQKRINKATVVYKQSKKVADISESVRLYDVQEFQELLALGGLETDRVFGDYSGAPLGGSRPRMIVVGHRA